MAATIINIHYLWGNVGRSRIALSLVIIGNITG